MRRSARTLVVLFIALGVMTVICSGLVFLLAGDAIVDFGRQAALQFSLSFRQDDLNQAMGTDDTDILFIINTGDTPRVIANNLANTALIPDAELFVDYVQAQGLDTQLEAGKYLLNQTMNTREIASTLTESRISQITLTILPGHRIEQVAALIDANRYYDFSGEDFMNVVGRGANVDPAFAQTIGLPPGMSLEGFLYPDTYALPLDVTATQLRDTLLNAFLNNTVDIRRQAAEQGFSTYELVTLASIVQREALHNDEKPRIASVYLNRLNNGWRLDADPTVQYGKATPGNWWPNITIADYQGVVSSYNTYRNQGLPPGPIANPDLFSLAAVVNPEETGYFFFRADCRSDGYHDFAVTYEEHLNNGC